MSTNLAPRPIGPYSQGVKVGDLVFTAGQGAIDPSTNEWLGGDIREQTERVLENLKGILEAAGSSLDRVVKTTVFLEKKELFREMNEVYSRYFPKNPPARSTVVTGMVRDGMLVEIEAVATR